MRTLTGLTVFALSVAICSPLSAQADKMKDKMQKEMKGEMKEGMHGMMRDAVASEMSANVADAAGKWSQLLGAIPDDKLDWRPMEGVRSIRELFTHIADANHFFMTFAGVEMKRDPSMPQDQSARENRFKNKADLAAHLKASFEHVTSNLDKLTREKLNEEVDMFGSKNTRRGAMIVNVGHIHEHLGQAIAYARVNSITPPWSEKN